MLIRAGVAFFRFALVARCLHGFLIALLISLALPALAADGTGTEVPLIIGNRTIHVFRAALRDISERSHLNEALDRGGEGWTSVVPYGDGVIVQLDGQPMFTVAEGDARKALGETPDVLANRASRELQTALSDFYVEYRLVVRVGAESSSVRPRVLGELHAAIQDVFNKYGVQIMWPHYLGDPDTAKLVPVANWHAVPAKAPPGIDQAL